jgi:hypothetical protein
MQDSSSFLAFGDTSVSYFFVLIFTPPGHVTCKLVGLRTQLMSHSSQRRSRRFWLMSCSKSFGRALNIEEFGNRPQNENKVKKKTEV